VSGDSMIKAGIHDGDILTVDRSLFPGHNKIVIVVVNGECTVKRILYTQDKIYLAPENDHYTTFEVTELMSFDIWGVVTNVIHPF
jgi:DNA polymerase V